MRAFPSIFFFSGSNSLKELEQLKERTEEEVGQQVGISGRTRLSRVVLSAGVCGAAEGAEGQGPGSSTGMRPLGERHDHPARCSKRSLNFNELSRGRGFGTVHKGPSPPASVNQVACTFLLFFQCSDWSARPDDGSNAPSRSPSPIQADKAAAAAPVFDHVLFQE
jgi:hypothetical protein